MRGRMVESGGLTPKVSWRRKERSDWREPKSEAFWRQLDRPVRLGSEGTVLHFYVETVSPLRKAQHSTPCMSEFVAWVFVGIPNDLLSAVLNEVIVPPKLLHLIAGKALRNVLVVHADVGTTRVWI